MGLLNNNLQHINRAEFLTENSTMARLRDIFMGSGPGDPKNILKQDSWIHKAGNMSRAKSKIKAQAKLWYAALNYIALQCSKDIVDPSVCYH